MRRRSSDRFGRVIRHILIAMGTAAAIYGQAEMLGEPWRHYVTIAGIALMFGIIIIFEWRDM